MSQDRYAEFLSKLNTDAALRGALEERFGDAAGGVPASDLIDFAGDHGYTFVVEDATEELSDTALDGVAGGGGAAQFLKLESRNFKVEIEGVMSGQELSFRFLKL